MEIIYIKNVRKGICCVRLIKVDACNNCIHLAGAVFDLLKYDKSRNCYIPLLTGRSTGCDGSLLVKHLDAGRYKFIETMAPCGYRIGSTPETLFEIPTCGCTGVREIIVPNDKICRPCVPCCDKRPCPQGCNDSCRERPRSLPGSIGYWIDQSHGKSKNALKGD